MMKQIKPAIARLGRILCCFSVVLAGCANIAPTESGTAQEPADVPAATVASRPSRIARTVPPESPAALDSKLLKVEIPDRPSTVAPVDLTDQCDDLFQRMRIGFSMPDINDDLVLYHQQWYLNRPDYLRRMVDRSSRYMYHILEELEKRGMPTELALLPMVESAYNPMAYSRAKASGLWQFIPSTGRRYNLDQTWWKDDRRDIVASTSAALDYLQSIYEMHGDWHLALASYNWGEGAVGRAIAKNQAQGLPTDYLSLTMPNETRNYVPKLQALKNIFKNPTLFSQLDLPKVPNKPFFATVTTDSHIDVKLAAKLAEMPVQDFVALNPAHNRPVIKPDSSLVIPAEKLTTFVSNLEAHEDSNKPLSNWQAYTFRSGDTLNKIARRFGMTVSELRAINGLTDNKTRIGPGTSLLVAGQDKTKELDMAALPEQPKMADPEPVARNRTYTVRRGDTLPAIAKRHDMSVAEIKRINKLRNDKIAAGTQLQLVAAQTAETAFTANAKKQPERIVAQINPGKNEAPSIRKIARPTEKPKAADSKPQGTARYTVRSGDTLYSISRQFKVAVNDLMQWNRVTPSTLRPGTTLTIR